MTREPREHTRLRILDAAAHAFVEGGYDATSIDAIADRLGATKGHVYHYYRSKVDVFLAIHVLACERCIDVGRPIGSGPGTPLERLVRMAAAHAKLLMEDQIIQRVSVQGVAIGFPKRTTESQRAVIGRIVELRDECEQLFADVIAEGVDHGDFVGVQPRWATKPLLGALNWTCLWYRPGLRSHRATIDDLASSIARQVVGGLCSTDAVGSLPAE